MLHALKDGCKVFPSWGRAGRRLNRLMQQKVFRACTPTYIYIYKVCEREIRVVTRVAKWGRL